MQPSSVADETPVKRKTSKAGRYSPPSPSNIAVSTLAEILLLRGDADGEQQDLFGDAKPSNFNKTTIYHVGDLGVLTSPCVAIVGTRKVSPEGAVRARRLARELVEHGIVVVSGLADGVDTVALEAAIEAGGRVVAVIGTPVDKAYPAKNRSLQEKIYREHLLVSQFEIGKKVYPSNFPRRNKVMAAISDATVIIEASDTSGTLHQAAECTRLGRSLFIAKSVVDDSKLDWPAKFTRYATTKVLTETRDVVSVVSAMRGVQK